MSIGHPGYNVTSMPHSQLGDPAWEIAFLFPPQGHWNESDYLALDRGGGRLIELVNGKLKVLPLPTIVHQLLLKCLLSRLDGFVAARALGTVVCAPMPVHLSIEYYREPDIVFFRPDRAAGREYPELADLVMEIVSSDAESRKRDLVDKRRDYATAGIPEYWIVDPQEHVVIVLSLEGKEYRVHGEFKPGSRATSALLPEFSIDVAELFAAGEAGKKS